MKRGALCVSIHDVSPETWPQCCLLRDAIREVADIPITLLVVPAYHHHAGKNDVQYLQALDACLRSGDELALHGYTHLDEGPAPAGWREWYARRIYTACEGEFAALRCSEARQRMQWGMDWFARHGWSASGFVAPAWLLGPGARAALASFPFVYTTTLTRFHFLAESHSLFSPSLVYSARSAWGSAISRTGTTLLARGMKNAPLVRLGLHPADVRYPATIRHMQRLLRRLAADRVAMTKAEFARAWADTRRRKPGHLGVPDGADPDRANV